jgi:hypothetical protein
MHACSRSLFSFLYFPSLHIRLYVALAVGTSHLGSLKTLPYPLFCGFVQHANSCPCSTARRKLGANSLRVRTCRWEYRQQSSSSSSHLSPSSSSQTLTTTSKSHHLAVEAAYRCRHGAFVRKKEVSVAQLGIRKCRLVQSRCPTCLRQHTRTNEVLVALVMAEWHEQECESGTSS